MEENEIMRQQIFTVIETQIKQNDPPETKITYDRLRKQGFDDYTSRQYIGQCVAVEIFSVMKYGEEFNKERFIKNLLKLPKEPFE